MNKQEVFDKVAAHLLQQKEKSMTMGRCMYRSANGLKCAIGCLIPDDLYESSIENTPVYELPYFIIKHIGCEWEDLSFLSVLQKIHDCVEPEKWREELIKLAEEKDLVWNHGL